MTSPGSQSCSGAAPPGSRIQIPTSQWLIHSSSQSGNSVSRGVGSGFARSARNDARVPFHFNGDLKKKKKGKAGVPNFWAPLNSQLTWQAQSQCCPLHSVPLRGFKQRAGFQSEDMKLVPTFSIGKNQKLNPIFSNEKCKQFILLSRSVY